MIYKREYNLPGGFKFQKGLFLHKNQILQVLEQVTDSHTLDNNVCGNK